MSTGSQQSRTLPWAQADVFAERPLEGNMLAIFTDASGLSDAEMQQLARETNLSETTFVLPGDPVEEREHGVRVRIFTTHEELPFAGHPTLGTAAWLWANHPTLRGADEVRLRLKVGTISVRFQAPAEGERGVYGEMRQRDPEFGSMVDGGLLAEACGLVPADLHGHLAAQVVSTGLPMCILPLASVEALVRLRADHAKLDPVLRSVGAKFLYAIARENAGTWRARLPFHGGDDPATGSAAGCAIGYLTRHNSVETKENMVFSQGNEVHRPSRIFARASLEEGAVRDVFVAGRTIFVASGRFTLL